MGHPPSNSDKNRTKRGRAEDARALKIRASPTFPNPDARAVFGSTYEFDPLAFEGLLHGIQS
jgi:hypothetical protein